MQYDVKTSTEYFNALENDWRKETLLEIRDLIRNSEPTINEGIEYKMLRFSIGNKTIFHLNAQKNFVGLYVGNIQTIDPLNNMLKEFDCGKGCIRIKKTQSVSDSSLPEFITSTIALIQSGEDVKC